MSLPAERMSRVDTAWLRMDNDVNLMMIVGVWILQPGITLEALAKRIEEKLLKYDRFRQRVEQDAVGANWVDNSQAAGCEAGLAPEALGSLESMVCHFA